jgi:hypothetical protein
MDTWSKWEKRTQNEPKRTHFQPKKCQNKPKTNPISHGGRPLSVDCPFTSGLTVQGMLVIVRSFLSLAELVDIFDIVFIDLRQ